LISALVVGLCVAAALRPPIPRRPSPFNLPFALGYLINELPFLGLWWLASGTLRVVAHPQVGLWQWWLITAIAAAAAAGMMRLAARATSARPELTRALQESFGPDAAPRYTSPSWWRLLLVPFISWRPDVRRIRNRRYGPARRGNRLDVYVSRRTRREGAPVLLYLHGGAFVMGSKLLGAHPLLYRLAAKGWVCMSVDYRLFGVDYRDQLADTRAAMTWARTHAEAYGGDPEDLFVIGGSAGAHLAATSTLSDDVARGVIALYGFYGAVGREATSPHDRIHRNAPPFLIMHGTTDTLVPESYARAFADRLRRVSTQPVAYAALSGAQHNFDFFHSIRFHAVTDAVIRFVELVVGGRSDPNAARRLDAHREGEAHG
jgi:acetyl esterase/lipase